MSDLEKMEEMLENAGYSKLESNDVDGNANILAHKEYFVAATSKYTILALGPGRVGETGCFTNLMFDLGTGKFLEHASIIEEEED